jgi:iron complex transport system ATP-binding protein
MTGKFYQTGSPSRAMLRTDGLAFRYPPRGARHGDPPGGVHGLSLSIDAGSVVGILGPNGSGKTTLIKLLSGALAPASGTVTFDGQDLRSLRRHALAQRMAVVPQETHLAFDYSVLEIVLMGRYPRLGAFEIEGPADVRAAMAALEATGTARFAERPFMTLSGGEKQRVVIASALAQLDAPGADDRPPAGLDRTVLFLDEPTASLDLRYQLELGTLLRRLNGDLGLTLLLSTHDLRLAAALCTHLVLLRDGRVLAEGAPAEVLQAPLVADLYTVDAGLVRPLLA